MMLYIIVYNIRGATLCAQYTSIQFYTHVCRKTGHPSHLPISDTSPMQKWLNTHMLSDYLIRMDGLDVEMVSMIPNVQPTNKEPVLSRSR